MAYKTKERRPVTGHLFQRGTVWWLRWRHAGREHAQSTGAREWAAALAARDEILTAWRRGAPAATVAGLALGDAWAWFSAHTSSSAAFLGSRARGWSEFVAATGAGRDVAAVGRSEVSRYLAGLKGLAPATVAGRRACLHLVFESLRAAGIVSSNPVAGVRFGGQAASVGRRALTGAEVAALLRVASGELRTVILVGLYTGLRLADAATLTLGACDVAAGMVRVRPHKTDRSTGAVVCIPLHPRLAAALPSGGPATALAPGLAALVASRGTAPVSALFAAACKRAGIRTRRTAPGRRAIVEVGFHSLRHTFLSALAAGGASAAVLRDLAGHSSAVMTLRYLSADERGKAAAIAALPAW